MTTVEVILMYPHLINRTGIANSLDLTDRILPRLQARPKCKPHTAKLSSVYQRSANHNTEGQAVESKFRRNCPPKAFMTLFKYLLGIGEN